MAESLGMDCKLFFDNVEFDNARNVNVPRDKSDTDVTKRSNNGVRAKRTTLKEISITWDMIYNPDDSQFTAVNNAYNNNDEHTVRVEDDQGNTLMEATGYVKKCDISQEMESASSVDVEFTVSALL